MTSMTIIDQLLVLLDDERPHSFEEIGAILPERSKQTISSTLGRLTAKGWVERDSGRARGQYRITSAGRAYVTTFLDQIKQLASQSWDGSWEQVIFTIPENDRKRRDDLRALLISLGYGRLHSWLWLSPWSQRSKIESYINATRSERDITIIQTGPLDAMTNQRIGRLFEWDWVALESDYQRVIRTAEAFLKQRQKSSFLARCIVYQYAKVLTTDPKFPKILPTHVPSAAKAVEIYQQVREYCYQE